MKTIILTFLALLVSASVWAQDRVCFTQPNGRVAIMSPAEGVPLAQIMSEDVPSDATAIRLCDFAALPANRDFRNAWTDNGTFVTVDLAKARVIQKERIDRARLQKARELLEREMLGEDVTAAKNQLRAMDAQTIVDGAATVAALRAAWPAGLNK